MPRFWLKYDKYFSQITTELSQTVENGGIENAFDLISAFRAQNPTFLQVEPIRFSLHHPSTGTPIPFDKTIDQLKNEGLGLTQALALVIVIAQPVTLPPLEHQQQPPSSALLPSSIELNLKFDHVYQSAFDKYGVNAGKLIEEPEVKSLICVIHEVEREATQPSNPEAADAQGRNIPFIFLTGSSGTGKTQMSLTVMSHLKQTEGGRPVFYLLASRNSGNEQSIYRYFANISASFLQCAQVDESRINTLPSVREDKFECDGLVNYSLFIYGFIYLLLEGNHHYGITDQITITPKRAEDVLALMTRLGIAKENRPFVILDEFNYYNPTGSSDKTLRSTESNANWLRLLRNSFRSVGILVMVTGTEARAANLLTLSTKSRKGTPTRWCYIVTWLPRANAECLDSTFISTLPPHLQLLLLNSRPLFAQTALAKMKTFDPVTSIDLDQVLSYVFMAILDLKDMKKHDESVLGQLLLPLNVSYSLMEKTVEDQVGTTSPLVHRHFARLLTPDAKKSILLTNGVLESCPGCDWLPSTTFPYPEDDLILHLAFMGTKTCHPVFTSPNSAYIPCSYRSQIDRVLRSNRHLFKMEYLKSKEQPTNDGNYLEAVMYSSLCLASHAEGLSGITVQKLLCRFAYNLCQDPKLSPEESHRLLYMYNDDDESTMVSARVREMLGDFADAVFPYLSAANVPWPKNLQEHIPTLTNAGRTLHKDRLDMKTDICRIVSQLLSLNRIVSGESKYRTGVVNLEDLKNILIRIPGNSWIHFVVASHFQNSYFEKESFEQFRDNNGLSDCLFVRMTVQNDGVALINEMDRTFNIPTRGTRSRPIPKQKYERLVLFIEVPF